MLITRVELENIKSYRQIAVDLRRGTTAISGANGAGKTTIVEAIGYALFDHLPYNQGQFVREGAKYGHMAVHFLGSDDRPYVVERRCGSGAYWFIYDCEADSKLEQKADVLDKLHELFGVDRERALSSLFKDALGVPQGTFTAIFLETARIRKQTFDTLLQIEDYTRAFEYLLEAQKQYKEQALAQQGEIQRLSYETRQVEEWRVMLKEERQRDQQQTEQIAQWTREREEAQERETVLKQQEDELVERKHRYEQCKSTYEGMQERLQDRHKELEHAREAQQVVEATRGDHQRFEQANEVLQQLRREESQRNALQKQYSGQQNILAKVQTNIEHLQKRLVEVEEARQRFIDLSPLADEQFELEKQLEELTSKKARFDELVKEGRRLVQQRDGYLQQLEERQKRIAAIEPLQPVAALLQERVEAVAHLRAQQSERINRQKQLQEKREQLRQKQDERETYVARLRKAETTITKIEDHRAEAEELPVLEQQHGQLSEQRFRLEGNIEGYVRSRKQSVGGQCPFLQEPCLNIKQRGVISLEAYFDGQIRIDRERLDEIGQQQGTLVARMTAVKKYADALGKLGQYIEQRDGLAEHLQRLAIEIMRLERETTEMVQDLDALKGIEQQIALADSARTESKKADAQVRELEGLRMQVQQLEEQVQQHESLIQERRQQTKELRGSEEQLNQVKQDLEKLNDPRGQKNAQFEKMKQEPTYTRQLQSEQQKLQATEQQLQALEQQLRAYAGIEVRIGEQEGILRQTKDGYQGYLSNLKDAQLLPQRQRAYEEILHATEQAQQALEVAEQAYRQAEATFDAEELDRVSAVIQQLSGNLSKLAEAIQYTKERIRTLERQIEQAEALLLELEAAQKEKVTLEELQTMMEMFRKLIKEAGPHVLKAMLGDISAEANRIFGEIMGDRTAQLSWQNEYEIVLRRQGINRGFAQLSGGEQMSAALSVRLALLKKLSSLNIAFFDEPTQNMDELRRMNLAEQIRRVRGFDQLIVISHDDTFEQGLDSLVRLRKVDGETRQVMEEEVMARVV